MSDKVMQDAEALLAVEKKATPGLWGYLDRNNGVKLPSYVILYTGGSSEPLVVAARLSVEGDAEFIVALRNTAPAIIRALMERIEEMELSRKGFMIQDIPNLYARIAHLEAERDIWRERAQRHGIAKNYDEFGPLDSTPYPTPTPEEIAARVEQNRKR